MFKFWHCSQWLKTLFFLWMTFIWVWALFFILLNVFEQTLETSYVSVSLCCGSFVVYPIWFSCCTQDCSITSTSTMKATSLIRTRRMTMSPSCTIAPLPSTRTPPSRPSPPRSQSSTTSSDSTWTSVRWMCYGWTGCITAVSNAIILCWNSYTAFYYTHYYRDKAD